MTCTHLLTVAEEVFSMRRRQVTGLGWAIPLGEGTFSNLVLCLCRATWWEALNSTTGGFGSLHTPGPWAFCKEAWLLGPKGRRERS